MLPKWQEYNVELKGFGNKPRYQDKEEAVEGDWNVILYSTLPQR